jgi:hypothetical protein
MRKSEGFIVKCTVSLITALILMILLALPGCAVKETAPTAMPQEDPVQSYDAMQKETAPTTMPQEVLMQSYDAMQAVKSFHFLLRHNTGGTPITMGMVMTKAEGNIVRPDKLQTTISGTFMGSAIDVKLVTVDGETMITNPLSGRWERLSDMFAALAVFDPATSVADIIKGLKDPPDASDEKVGNVLCYHLKGAIASEALKSLTSSGVQGEMIPTEIWIAKDSLLVYQVSIEGKITQAEEDGIVRTLTFADYDKAFDITLPEAG